jgi:uncharacterized membrane protein
MLIQILILILLTFIPFLELRFSIPVGILTTIVPLPFNNSVSGMGLNPFLVLIVCVLANILLGIIFYEFLFILEKIPFLYKHIHKFLISKQKKIKPYVEKYGILGISLFIAIPFPGTGSYSGGLGSFLLGIKRKDFYIANAIGVTLAGIIVTMMTLGLDFFI